MKIKIKRKFWFGYTTYRVQNHFYETSLDVKRKVYQQNMDTGETVETFTVEKLPIRPRLVLHLTNGDFVVISNIENRDWAILPDKAERVKAPKKPVVPTLAAAQGE